MLLYPGFHNGLSLFPILADFTIQALIPQLIVEAVDVAILTGTIRFDE